MRDGSAGPRRARRRIIAFGPVCLGIVFAAFACRAAEVLIVGDTRLKPVADLVSGIRQTLEAPAGLRAFDEVGGELGETVAREGVRVVVALGKEAIAGALRLPPPVAVVYGLTVVPPESSRPHTTGTYMATPVGRYVDLLRKHLPSLRRLSIVGSRDLLEAVGAGSYPQVSAHPAQGSFELVNGIQRLERTDALLLLPDAASLTPTAVEQIYLYSFRKKVPLLGISEKHVKQGALLALTFDPVSAGRQIGELAREALRGADLGRIPPAPSREFDLFVNTDTARAMGIDVPAEMLEKAKGVYPSAGVR